MCIIRSVLTTAGEGTWMLGTDRGLTWLARWHRTTPSVRAAPRSLGNDTLSRASMFWINRQRWTCVIRRHVLKAAAASSFCQCDTECGQVQRMKQLNPHLPELLHELCIFSNQRRSSRSLLLVLWGSSSVTWRSPREQQELDFTDDQDCNQQI